MYRWLISGLNQVYYYTYDGMREAIIDFVFRQVEESSFGSFERYLTSKLFQTLFKWNVNTQCWGVYLETY